MKHMYTFFWIFLVVTIALAVIGIAFTLENTGCPGLVVVTVCVLYAVVWGYVAFKIMPNGKV